MKVLELFAGSRSIGKVADKMGFEVFSVDIKPFDKIDLVKDINELEISDIPFIPDMIVAGTPCTTYSLAAISHHRYTDYSPKSEFAKFCDLMNVRLLSLIKKWNELNPKLCWYIENPRGVLKHMDFMRGIPSTMITYCSYGDIANKPTIIWSNNLRSLFNPDGWEGRPICKRYKYDDNGNVINKHCHHEPAQRGSQTGTQGKKGNYERSEYPVELCEELLISTAKKLGYA